MDWDKDKIAGLSTDDLKNLSKNAEKRNRADLVELCSVELEKRKPKVVSQPRSGSYSRPSSDTVIGFHFVCAKEQGVTRNADGTRWTGTWVVAQVHAERAIKIGAYVALHESKAQSSYLQGVIRDFRRSEREQSYAEGQEVQTEYGIDFLFEPTSDAYQWVGDGSGEKGYAWASRN